MRAEVEIGPVRHALDLAETGSRERKPVLDVARAGAVLGVVRELVLALFPQLEVRAQKPDAFPPLHPRVAPEAVPLERLLGVAEELDLHLLELARAKREVARRDLVAEGLAGLRDAERNLHPG